MLGIVLGKKEGIYSIGTKYGVLDTKYSRKQFEMYPSRFLVQEDVPQNTISDTQYFHFHGFRKVFNIQAN